MSTAIKPDISGLDVSELSAARRRVLFEILPEVVPSQEGQPRFHKILTPAQITAGRTALGDGYTTCGGLPAYVLGRLGVGGGIASGGLEGVREAAQELGAWVPNSHLHRTMYASFAHTPRLPKPGDIYLQVAYGKEYYIKHIGIVVDPSGPVWWTADAGQGPRRQQAAIYCRRKYDADRRTLSHLIVSDKWEPEARILDGWIDLDKAILLTRAAANPDQPVG